MQPKKILSLVLCICLMLSTLTVVVVSADEEIHNSKIVKTSTDLPTDSTTVGTPNDPAGSDIFDSISPKPDDTTSTTNKTPTSTTTAACVHKSILENVKSATYFADGYTGDTVCEKCGKVISKGKVTAKLTLKNPKLKVKAVKGKKVRVTYKKVAGATGFQVRYKIKGKWKIKTYKATKNVKKIICKLSKGRYKVQIRSMAKQSNQKVFSKWSKVKKVTVK